MPKFKVGDRVLIFNPTRLEFHLKAGKIINIQKPYVEMPSNILVEFSDTKRSRFNEVELEIAVRQPYEEGKIMSKKVSHYLQRDDNRTQWEEVDQYTWDNYQHALNADGKPRYSGNKVMRVGDDSTLEIKDATHQELAVVMRFCGVRGNEAPGSVSGGFVRTPEFIEFTKGRKTWIHRMNGEDFIAKKKAGVPHVAEEVAASAKQIAQELKLGTPSDDEPGLTRKTPLQVDKLLDQDQ